MDGAAGASFTDEHWRGAGERIETLLDASSAAGTLARERSEQLVREVVDLYGAGLRHILSAADPATVEALTRDELVASLLLVHGLHPHDLRTRVGAALDSVRPYLGSHGGDVELLDVADGVVRLELAGSCRTCPSSSVTLELAVEEAVRAAAPEIEAIEVVTAAAEPGLIATDSLFARVHAEPAHSGASWIPVPELDALGPDEVGGFAVAGLAVLACRIGDTVFVYRDRCGVCDRSMAGTSLVREPGADPFLRCPVCHAGFDIVHAGAGIDCDGHLEPLPVLMREGARAVAVPAEVTG